MLVFTPSNGAVISPTIAKKLGPPPVRPLHLSLSKGWLVPRQLNETSYYQYISLRKLGTHKYTLKYNSINSRQSTDTSDVGPADHNIRVFGNLYKFLKN